MSAPEPEETSEAAPSVVESWLLKLLLRDDAPMEWVVAHLDLHWIQHSVVRRVIQMRLQAHHEQTWHGLPGLLQEIEDEPTRRLITAGAAEQRLLDDVERKVQETLLRLRNQFIDRELSALRVQMLSPGLPTDELEEMGQRQALLRRLKLEPLAPLGGD